MMVSRRALLSMLPAVVLCGCATVQNISQAASDAAAIAAALKGLLPTIVRITGIGTALSTTLGGVVDELSSVAAQIAAAKSGTLVSLVQRLGAGVITIATLLAPVAGLPIWVLTVLGAAQALLPIIMSSIGVVATPPTSLSAKFGEAIAMRPEEARSILKLAAA